VHVAALFDGASRSAASRGREVTGIRRVSLTWPPSYMLPSELRPGRTGQASDVSAHPPVPLPLEEFVDLGGADLGPTPVEPGRRGERVWRFEDGGHRPQLHGRCVACHGQHVPSREILDEILRKVQKRKPTLSPCTCDCCALHPQPLSP